MYSINVLKNEEKNMDDYRLDDGNVTRCRGSKFHLALEEGEGG